MVLTDKGLISGHGLIGDGNSNGTVSFENWDYPGCGFEEPSTERILAMRREERRYTSKSRPLYVYSLFCRYFPDSRFCLPSVEIDVYIHSVQTISGTGRLSTSAIRAMVRQASSSFRLSGFRFRVRGIRSIVNSNYYNSATRSDEEIALMTKHKRGGAETLNVYLKRVHNDRGEFCGYANLAQQAANAGVRDSVVINPACAGDEKTMAHEIGMY